MTTIARTSTHPKRAAKPTDYDAVRESQARRSADQGVHVPLVGQHHFAEAAAQIDQAEGAYFTGRVA